MTSACTEAPPQRGRPERPPASRLVRTGGRWTLTAVGSITADLRPLPDFLIIGAKRSGTTSLFRALEATEGVGRLRPAARHLKGVHYFDRNFSRGERWYRGHFPVQSRRRGLTGEASPYYLHHPAAPERAAGTVPAARLVVLLRDPAWRAVSHHGDEVRNGREPLDLRRALQRELAGNLGIDLARLHVDPTYYSWQHEHLTYLEQGRYAQHLRRWRLRFPPEQMLVLRSEDLFTDPGPCLERLAEFLQLPALAAARLPALNAAGAPSPDRETLRWLEDYFAPHNLAVQELLGQRHPWW